MFKQNDFIIYKKDVCKIKGIKQNHLNGLDYYVLEPIDDKTLTIEIPSNTEFIRRIISKKELEKIINKISEIEVIKVDNERAYEQIYKELLKGNHLDLIKIIKTTYLRNQNRTINNKKISEKDDIYFKKAERLLYNEFSIVLNMTFDETKNYVCDRVKESIH